MMMTDEMAKIESTGQGIDDYLGKPGPITC
jgi:DNA-binding response OmpR family regulator